MLLVPFYENRTKMKLFIGQKWAIYIKKYIIYSIQVLEDCCSKYTIYIYLENFGIKKNFWLLKFIQLNIIGFEFQPMDFLTSDFFACFVRKPVQTIISTHLSTKTSLYNRKMEKVI